MEKPDSNGYINIMWPSRNVPHGGIFHTSTVENTIEQQNILKVLLEESKFDLKLRQTRAFGLRSDDRKSLAANDASSASAPLRVANVVRPHTSRRRSLSAIRSSGALDFDTYRPLKRGEDRERMKERLANTMAYGDSPEQTVPKAPQPRTKPVPNLPTAKESWNELVTQIRERAEWLAEMEYLGEAAPHREIVQDQIAERMRALDALGLDSECSSLCSTTRSVAHSTAHSAAHSTAHSTAHSPGAELQAEVPLSATRKGEVAKKSKQGPRGKRSKKIEENVMAYNHLSPLGYSPRRRV